MKPEWEATFNKSQIIESSSSSDDESEIGDHVPKAIDLMSGPNAPVACALRACGWEVEAYDILISEQHDLSNSGLQRN